MKSSLYIHWPFCESKCPYCDFNSHVREKISNEDFENAYLKEIEYYSSTLPKTEITSIFFGGGTPSLMRPEAISKILNEVSKKFAIKKDIEITLEANPSSSEIEKFKNFKKAGINRLSLGIQSFEEDALKFLGRRHNSKEAVKAIKMAGEVFDNFSFDLIYALPNQTEENWSKQLEYAFSFGSPHLSLYQLTIEKGTDFYGQYKRKEFSLPLTEMQEKLYDLTVKKAKDAGLLQYEISNFAKRGFESQHNLNYWQYGDYIGIGAGAHGRLSVVSGLWSEVREDKCIKQTADHRPLTAKKATLNLHSPEKWLQAVQEKGQGIQSTTKLSQEEQIEELVYMGLRIKKGLDKRSFKKLAGESFEEFFNKRTVKNLIESGYIKITENKVRPTYQGLKLHRGIINKLFSISR